jgi:hypothetical protein
MSAAVRPLLQPLRTLARALLRACAAFALLSLVAMPSAVAVVVRTAVAYRPVPVYRPVAPVARTAAVVGTAAVIGSVVYSLPPSCTSTMVGDVAYQRCGPTWYRPAYSGTTVSYTVVSPPR